jgi:hypothetical protein
MLYDFAELFKIGLTRENKISDHDFGLVANATQNSRAIDFIKWWRKKVSSLSSNRLWHMRPEIVHRGCPEMRARVYAHFPVIVPSDRSVS